VWFGILHLGDSDDVVESQFGGPVRMFPHPSKLAGPVKHSNPDPDTLILTCDRGLQWPVLIGSIGLGLLLGSIWVPVLLLYSPFYGVPCLLGAFYFVALRADVVLSRKNATLEVRPMIPLFQSRTNLRIPFSSIREFLVESEFDLGAAESSPFIWHLTAITLDGAHHRLTWHFVHGPVSLAAQEAARITGKPLREERDPCKSSTWSHWGYNFFR
jgi:hypothetical protein